MKNQNKLITLQKILTATKQPTNTRQISLSTNLNTQTLNPILETLYNRDYLDRTQSTKQNEKYIYTITKKGKQLLTNIESVLPIINDLWNKL